MAPGGFPAAPPPPLLTWGAQVGRGARRALLRGALGLSLALLLLWASLFLYGSFYWAYLPAAAVLRPLHLAFRSDCERPGPELCSFPTANVSLLGEHRAALRAAVPDLAGAGAAGVAGEPRAGDVHGGADLLRERGQNAGHGRESGHAALPLPPAAGPAHRGLRRTLPQRLRRAEPDPGAGADGALPRGPLHAHRGGSGGDPQPAGAALRGAAARARTLQRPQVPALSLPADLGRAGRGRELDPPGAADPGGVPAVGEGPPPAPPRPGAAEPGRSPRGEGGDRSFSLPSKFGGARNRGSLGVQPRPPPAQRRPQGGGDAGGRGGRGGGGGGRGGHAPPPPPGRPLPPAAPRLLQLLSPSPTSHPPQFWGASIKALAPPPPPKKRVWIYLGRGRGEVGER